VIVTRTPLRVPLGGGGTDLPSYYSRFGGFIVSAAINKYTFITVNRRFEDSIRVSYSQTEIVDRVEDIQHRYVREALKFTGIEKGIEIVSIADLPSNTGMGTSGSFLVGLLNALRAYKGGHVSRHTLAMEACHIEMDILKEPVGKQDQYTTALGGLTCLNIDQQGKVTASQLVIPDHILEELEGNLLFFYTGIRRSASEVLWEQNNASQKHQSAVHELLHTIKEIGYRVRTALETGDLATFGALLDLHWQVKKGLSAKVSSDRLDRTYQIAKEAGALGGKIMGAGGGGFFMFYCPNQDRSRLRQAMAAEGLREVRLRFEPEGSKVLVNF